MTLDIESLGFKICSADAARRGDFSGLKGKLEKGTKLTDAERLVLVELIEGKLKLPRGRKKEDLTRRNAKFAILYNNGRRSGVKSEALYHEIASRYGVSRATVAAGIKADAERPINVIKRTFARLYGIPDRLP